MLKYLIVSLMNHIQKHISTVSIDADRMCEVYQKQWRIEELHKSIKQNASLSKSPTKTIQTQCNHLFASMVAYCKLKLLKVKTAA